MRTSLPLLLLLLVALVRGSSPSGPAAVFSIASFGAVSGVDTVAQAITNGQALRAAIEAADAQGPGSTALVPQGLYWMLPTAPFQGVDGVTLQIDGTLSALVDLKSWPNSNTTGKALDFISFADSSNIRITGQGAVQGNGYQYWWEVILTGHDNRPNLLWMETCKNVELDSLLFENSPQYHIYLHDVANVYVHDLTVFVDVEGQRDMLGAVGKLTGPDDPLGLPEGLPTFPLNTDGIDPSGFNITITRVNITCFDDAVAVKPCNGNCKLSSCSSNITISDAYVKYGVGMTIGSVPPNDAVNCVQHVLFRNIYFDKPLKAVYVKTNPGEHGTGLIDDIVYENMYAKEPIYWAVYIGPQQQSQPGNGTHTGCSFLYPLPHTQCPTQPRVPITNVVLRNVTIEDALLSVGMIRCNETKPCSGFVFDGVRANSVLKWPVGPGYLCENVSGTSSDSDPVPSCLTPQRAPVHGSISANLPIQPMEGEEEEEEEEAVNPSYGPFN